MVVSIKFDVLDMLNIFLVENVFLLKKKQDTFVKSVDFFAMKTLTIEETFHS
jgi:hypothetical protein